MRPVVKYIIGFTVAIVLLNVWFMAAGSSADFKGIYAALSGVLSAVIIEGRKKRRGGRHDRGEK